MQDLIIIGGSGFGKEVIWLAQETNQFTVIGILDDNALPGSKILNIPVLGKVSDVSKYASASFSIAIGNPRVRQKIANKLLDLGIKNFANLIHPSVSRSKYIEMGIGNIICAGATLTTDIVFGDHNIININSTVGHDCRINNFCTVAPLVAISGNVTLNNLVEVGTGAVIRQGLTLEAGSMLGMGGVLTKNIESNQIFIGNPAKFFKTFE